jgi:hypothetical protein
MDIIQMRTTKDVRSMMILLTVGVLCIHEVNAFIPVSIPSSTIQSSSSSTSTSTSSATRLFLQNKQQNYKNKMNKQLPIIPVIGPILTAPPLMIGSEMILDPPTPLQWKALQECVVVHQNQLKRDQEDQEELKDRSYDLDDDHDYEMNIATIDAAPLIAVIDDASSLSKVNPPFSPFNEGGRYATLAAVVGITNKKQLKSDDDDYFNDNSYDVDGDNDDNDNDKVLVGGEENFMEYMNLCPVDDDEGTDLIVPLSSSIRLVGVGRAVLRKFFYRIPTDLCVDEEYYYIDDDDENETYGDEEDDLDVDVDVNFTNGGYEDNTPIVMSQFEPLVDDSSIYSLADPEKIGEKGQRSYRISPVHAMSELFNIASRVSCVHDDKLKLIAGIKAAKARLEINRARRRGEIEYDDDLEDYDGLGVLFEDYVSDKIKEVTKQEKDSRMSVDEFLSTFKGNMERIDPSDLPQNQPTKIELLEASENYGMGYFGAFSSIADLTAVTVKELEPYYSQKYRDREEHEAEISSFVVFRALGGFIDNKELAYALHCTSSVERLTRGYELMIDHKIQLKKIAERISDELRECGEECTDLF